MTTLDATGRLRDALLRDTVAWCVERSPFYRRTLGGGDAGGADTFAGLDDLPTLPILFRHDVIEHHAEIVCDPSPPAAVQHTTGTTGPFLQLYRSAAEQAFIWDFFSAQLEQRKRVPGPRPLHLSLANAYHGALTPMPSWPFVLSVGVHDQAQASQARGVLERSHDLPGIEPRVSALIGTERMVKAFTAYLLAEGFDLADSPVRTIVLFGGHVTPARKELLGRLWGARLQDVYSLTELFGGATQYGLDSPLIFDPHVVPEVVHPRTLEPVENGIGVLVLTGLYPFTQQMPFVRYFTGDLVEITTGAGEPGGLQVRYRGRLSRSVLDTTGSTVVPLLLSGPLYEALEAVPDIAISPRFPDLDAGPGLELTGDLHYAVDHAEAADTATVAVAGPPTVTVRLGLRYAAWMYPERVTTLVADLTDRILADHPELAARCADGRMALRIEPVTAADVAPYDSK